MELLGSFVDDQYLCKGINHVRLISRAVILRPDGKAAVHHLIRNDIFGEFEYYETPGGGADAGESLERAAVRECKEETGYAAEIISELGEIDDYYNLIGRQNKNFYYLCRQIGPCVGTHFVSQGDHFIKETLYLPITSIIALYESTPDSMLPLLVKRRELPIWRKALTLQAKGLACWSKNA